MYYNILCVTLSFSEPECQLNVPLLDGGEGCSELIIHGTNVDLGESADSNFTTAKL